MELLRSANGFFGPSMMADITLVVQILFYFVLSAGVIAQLQGHYKTHDRLQVPVVILNIFFIIFVMVPTFRGLSSSMSARLTQLPVMVTAAHAMLGSVAQLLSIYCLLAGLKILPRRIGALRYWMWGAYFAWTVAVIFGIGVYIVYYTGFPPSPPPPPQPPIEQEQVQPEPPPPPPEDEPTVDEPASVATPTAVPVEDEPTVDEPASVATPTPELLEPSPTDVLNAEHDGG
jgi:uncharacterized membrane protein YozB (DUF420 family)